MSRLLSVNVGLPRDIEWKGRTVHTGIWNDPVPGRCRVGRLNLGGDGQGDLAGHEGEQRAVSSPGGLSERYVVRLSSEDHERSALTCSGWNASFSMRVDATLRQEPLVPQHGEERS